MGCVSSNISAELHSLYSVVKARVDVGGTVMVGSRSQYLKLKRFTGEFCEFKVSLHDMVLPCPKKKKVCFILVLSNSAKFYFKKNLGK